MSLWKMHGDSEEMPILVTQQDRREMWAAHNAFGPEPFTWPYYSFTDKEIKEDIIPARSGWHQHPLDQWSRLRPY